MRETPLNKTNFNPEECVGQGREKRVFNDPEHEKHVVGIFKPGVYIESNEQLKIGRYYFTKILHILFPEHIPDWHHVEKNVNAYVADKVIIDEDKTKNRFIKQQMLDESLFFKKLKEIINEGEYHLGNFCVDVKGNLVFLDSFNPWVLYHNVVRQYFSNKKLREAIAAIPDELQRREAETYYARLIELRDAEFKKFYNET